MSTALKSGWLSIWLTKVLPIEFIEPPPVIVKVWILPSAEVNIIVAPVRRLVLAPLQLLGISIVPTAIVPGDVVVGVIIVWMFTQSSALKHSITNKP